jgi:hypothetical protein
MGEAGGESLGLCQTCPKYLAVKYMLGGFDGKSDRFLIITFIIRLVFAHEAGGEGFAFSFSIYMYTFP